LKCICLQAISNAQGAGVKEIDFVCCDFKDIISTVRADVIFLSPPWGGPSYAEVEVFDLSQPYTSGASSVAHMTRALNVADAIACFLPRNTNCEELSKYVKESLRVSFVSSVRDVCI